MASGGYARKVFSLFLALTMLFAFIPVAAGAGAAKKPRVRLTVEQIKAKRSAAVRAFAFEEEEPPPAGYIEGQLTHTDGMWEDAGPYVLAFQYDAEWDEWFVASMSEVATDGTYSLGVPEAGDYRVGAFDWAYVYADAYYDGATTIDAASDVSVAASETVSGIDIALTALPENIISGTVSFSGAPAPGGDAWASAYVYDTDAQEWFWGTDGRVREDGTYRIHLPEPGTYRVGFEDYSDVFETVFYLDAASADEATDVVLAGPATTVTGIDQTMTVSPSRRIEGLTRYETAVEASKFGFREGSSVVVLATGENWPDAISGSALAAQMGAPLLLTRTASLPDVTRDEILRLQPDEIVIVGGYSAISLDVEIAIRTELEVPMVSRIAGRDRYETASLIAEDITDDLEPIGSSAGVRPSFIETQFAGIVVATGERFPDAMSAAPLAANAMAPVVLVRQNSVPASVSEFLARHPGRFTSALVVGGPSAISTATALNFPSPTRIAGDDRYETSAEVAQYGIDHFGMRAAAVGIASGTSFPDGLAAVPVLAGNSQPLLLTRPDSLSVFAEQFMSENGTVRALVFGGERAVSADTYEQILEVLQ